MNTETLINELEHRIKFHRENQNDPANVSTAVMVALEEVLNAVKAATRYDIDDDH